MVQAVLFDFDGVVVQTEELHKESFLELLPQQVEIRDRWYYEFAGTGSGRIFRALLEEYDIDADVNELVEKRRKLFMEKVKSNKLKETPGLKDFLSFLESRGVKTAVVSGGHRSYITELLDMLGLEESFDFIISADDSSARKPDPGPFLIAAESLGVKPGGCLVIEDSYAGCEAARKAGMKLVWVRPHESLERPECDLEIRDFRDSRILRFFG
ncbi:HAD-IA family hydrolase [Candidatus Micrarchaeota archaeon]|nr:HAD-IA family hydrolase [Candidatus Micrarchaeota archaeon]